VGPRNDSRWRVVPYQPGIASAVVPGDVAIEQLEQGLRLYGQAQPKSRMGRIVRATAKLVRGLSSPKIDTV
jgi:hypothetical protein